MSISTFKLKLLVRVPSETNPGAHEVKYMIEGTRGNQIWGKRTSGKNTKLSSLISLIHQDSMSVFRSI